MSVLLGQGDAFYAALQSAGTERKSEGWIQQGMKEWLSKIDSVDVDLICLTEYRGLDFVFITRPSVGSDLMKLDTMFEAKFNFTSQNAELLNRPQKASQQLRAYVQKHPGVDGYLLYMLADHKSRKGALVTHDRGWQYLGAAIEGRFEAGIRTMQASAEAGGLERLGHATHGVNAGDSMEGWLVHLELFALRSAAAARIADTSRDLEKVSKTGPSFT